MVARSNGGCQNSPIAGPNRGTTRDRPNTGSGDPQTLWPLPHKQRPRGCQGPSTWFIGLSEPNFNRRAGLVLGHTPSRHGRSTLIESASSTTGLSQGEDVRRTVPASAWRNRTNCALNKGRQGVLCLPRAWTSPYRSVPCRGEVAREPPNNNKKGIEQRRSTCGRFLFYHATLSRAS